MKWHSIILHAKAYGRTLSGQQDQDNGVWFWTWIDTGWGKGKLHSGQWLWATVWIVTL